MQIISTPIRKTVIFIHLQIFDSIIGLWAYIIEIIWGLVDIHYKLQSNGTMLLCHLFNGHVFLDLDLEKI